MTTIRTRSAATPPTAPRRRPLVARAVDLTLGLLGLAAIGLLWALLAANMQAVRLPAPGAVWEAMWSDLFDMRSFTYATFLSGGIVDGLTYTTLNVLVGVGIGAVGGYLLGLVMGRMRLIGQLLDPPLIVLGTVPVLIVLPFLVTWFGTARLAQSGLVIFFSFITVAAVTRTAVTNTAGLYEQSARCLGASSWTVVREVVCPSITPQVVGAVRISFAAGWSFEVLAEILGAQHGIGRIIQAMGTLSATDHLIACLAWLAITALVVDGILVVIGESITRWKEQ